MRGFYASAEMRRRSRAFDRITSHLTAQEYDRRDDYAAEHVLGQYNSVYRSLVRAAVQGSFLPNVRHGVAYIPEKQQADNHVALLPVDVQGDEAIVVERHLARPTPQKSGMASQLGLQSSNYVDRPLRPPQAMFRRSNNGALVAGYTHAERYISPHGSVVTGRPMIVMPLRPTLTPVLEAYTAGHEFVHAVDLETWNLQELDVHRSEAWHNLRAALECHAYAAGRAFVAPEHALDERDYEIMASCGEIWMTDGKRSQGDEFSIAYNHMEMPQLSSEALQRLGGMGLIRVS